MWDPGRYETATDELDLDGISMRITRVAAIDKLYDDLVARGAQDEQVRDERIPYWADLWPAAIGLSQYLIHNKQLVSGKRVLEIGCGLGLAGLVAASLGGEVTITDYMDEALALARINALDNKIEPAAFKKLDWRKPDPSLAAELVLASDVAYERRSFDHLPHAFRTLVRPGGTVLVSDPGRRYAGDFFKSLEHGGFEVSVVTVPVQYREIETRVQVYRMVVNSDQ